MCLDRLDHELYKNKVDKSYLNNHEYHLCLHELFAKAAEKETNIPLHAND